MNKRFALAGSAVALVAASYAAMAATPAGAVTPPPNLAVTLSACGTGSSAAWDASGDPVLTIGTAPAATCGAPTGSTYNPAYAQVVLPNVNGTAVPTNEPVFATDHYNSGSPRFVVELNNGHALIGYPAASGLNGTDMAWASDALNSGNTYGPYAAAYTAANASTTTIKDAFIVQDADQVPGTVDTLTNIQFDGATVQVRHSNMVQVKNRATNNCLNENKNNGQVLTFACNPQQYVSLRWQVATFSDGSQYLQSVQTGQFVRDNGAGQQLTLTGTPTPMSFRNGGVFVFPDSLVMTVNHQGSFVPVVGEHGLNPLNNGRWDFGLVS